MSQPLISGKTKTELYRYLKCNGGSYNELRVCFRSCEIEPDQTVQSASTTNKDKFLDSYIVPLDLSKAQDAQRLANFIAQAVQFSGPEGGPAPEARALYDSLIRDGWKNRGNGFVRVREGSQVSDERAFMELAINEARQSKAESGRTDATPFVGVVVVKDGEFLEKAYRGELGEGDHAEYTVLEKKLRDKSVSGATVYCTLEPCTTRRHPKWPCADWLVTRKVARVVIAMLDPNPMIRGLGEQRLREAGIDVQRFPKDLADQVEEMNRRFIHEQKARAEQQQSQQPKAADDGLGGQVAHSIINFGASDGRMPPKLVLSFDREKDVERQANTVGLNPSVLSTWVRIRVENPHGRKTAKDCTGYLTGVKWLGPDKNPVDEPLIGSRPMKWEHLPGEFERDLHAGDVHLFWFSLNWTMAVVELASLG